MVKGVSSFTFILIAMLSVSAHAEVWDLGYTKPVVEEIPTSIDTTESSVNAEQEMGSTINSDTKDAVANAEKNTKATSVQSSDLNKPGNSITRISTSKNTYGVETVENPGIKIYLSPYAGLTSLLGNTTVNVSPQYTFGGRLGFLISGNLMFDGGYSLSSINTSAPITYSLGYQPDNVFELRQSTVDAGVKLFFLGRESRLRPFVGASLGLANSKFNYTNTYRMMMGNLEDLQIKQFQAMGQLGAEFAITKALVATASFNVNGILSSSTKTTLNESTASGLEASRLQAGNSLSHSSSYMGSVGLGMYF